MKIKNWEKYQHYRNRRPPWIKLYRELLDDIEFHKLSGDEAKTLFMCWLVASDDEEMLGTLPPIEELAFRLRLPVDRMASNIQKLSHWINGINDASNVIALCAHDDSVKRKEPKPKTADKNIYPQDFETFWQAYPKKIGKLETLKRWKIAKNNGLPPIDELLKILENHKQQRFWKEGKIYKPQNWIKDGHWEDEISNESSYCTGPLTAAEAMRQRGDEATKRFLEGGGE